MKLSLLIESEEETKLILLVIVVFIPTYKGNLLLGLLLQRVTKGSKV